MSSRSIPTSWVGYYAYDPIEEVDTVLPIVTFKMTWEFGWFGRFKGTVKDGPNSDMLETGMLRGYCWWNKIEFTKYMPVETLINSDGTSTKTHRAHPPIHYYGVFDPISKSLGGEWYIAPFSNSIDSYPGTTGTWTAKPS